MGSADTNVSLANMALSSTGNKSTIASLTEQSNEAIFANLWFNDTRDELLRMAPWDCAFNYNTLTLITASPGTPENPANSPLNWNKTIPAPPWAYEYQYPADCLRACFVVPQFMQGFATGVPVTTAVTGGVPSFWNGPPARFKVGIDQPQTILTAAIVGGGAGHAVGDTLNLDSTNGVGVPGILKVTAVSGGVITGVSVFMGGSYSTAPTNPVNGGDATFNLTLSAAVNRKVILTNQEFAILAYVQQNTDVTLWDSQFIPAFVHLLGARLVYSLTGDKALANERIKMANELIIMARATDGNEGITVNDVTPDWIRTRGIMYPVDFGWSPNIGFDWGGLVTMY